MLPCSPAFGRPPPRTPGGNLVFPLRNAGDKRSSQVSRALKAQFRAVDKDRNGMLDQAELAELLRQGNPSISDREVQAIFGCIDQDGSGKVLFDEFIDFLFMPGSSNASSRSSSVGSKESGSEGSLSCVSITESDAAMALATREARKLSVSCLDVCSPELSKSGESLLAPYVPDADFVEISGSQFYPEMNGIFTKRLQDWVVTASNGFDEFTGTRLNGRPIYIQQSKDGKVPEDGPKRYLFYGWTEHWGRWGQAGWFYSDELPPDQEPVERYLLFCPCSRASAPDRCRAAWETTSGRRDKRLLCEALPEEGGAGGGARAGRARSRGAARAVAVAGLLEEELWQTAAAEDSSDDGSSAGSAASSDASGASEAEWAAQTGEDDWQEMDDDWEEELPAAPRDDEEPELEVPAVEVASRPVAGRRKSHAAGRPRSSPQPRRLSEDLAVRQGPGFVVVTKQERRNSWLDQGVGKDRKKEEEAKKRAAKARMEEQRQRRAKALEEIERRRQVAVQRRRESLSMSADGHCGFPASKESIGESSVETDGWGRLAELHERPCLFTRIMPDDVLCESSAGNYWFLSACAVVAEYPAWIQAMFGRTTRLSPEGKYRVRFFHPGAKEFIRVNIDDNVPTIRDCPAFAGITGEGGIWVALVEKAFAKLCLSYANAEWGTTAYGLLYLCGGRGAESWARLGPGRWWRRSRTEWRGMTQRCLDRGRAEGVIDDGRRRDAEELWMALCRCMWRCRPVACRADKEACATDDGACGLLSDRSYALLSAVDVPAGRGTALRLVYLRNPFGVGEWQGRWGRGSEAWEQNPSVAAAVELRQESHGAFWMSYHDFLRYFVVIDFVKKSMPVQGCGRAKPLRVQKGFGGTRGG